MKNLRFLGLAALITTASMAFTAGASADYVTTTTGGAAATPTIHWVNEGGHLVFQNSIANFWCNSTTESTAKSHGAGEPVSGPISTLTFTGCTNSWHVTTVSPGSLSVTWTDGHNGILTWTGSKIDTTRFGVTCVLETNATTIGTLTGGNPATLHIEASIPINASESGALCGTSVAKWEGKYVTTSPLYVVDS